MTNFSKTKLSLVALTVFLSQSIPIFQGAALAADGDVRIAGQPVFTLQSGAGSQLSQRADTVQNNLDNALVAAQDKSANAVGVTYVKGLPVVTLGGYQVVSVDSDDATQAHTTPAEVAQKWSDGIKRALADQASVTAYVGQLSGASSAGSTTATANLTPNQPSYIPPGGNRNGNVDQYNSNPSNNQPASAFTQPPSGNYGQPPNGNYGQPQSGAFSQPQGGGYNQNSNGGYRQGRLAYAPAGQLIQITLQTSLSTQVARAGDLIQATINQNVMLGDSSIPAGSAVIGQVTEAEPGRRMTKSGELGIKFTRIRTPDGTETPITAHLVGGIEKYHAVAGEQDTVKGEGMGNKVGSVAFRGLIGAGGGAALGTAVGAIAGGGYGAGRGAWSGTAIGGGLGVADSLLLRKGAEVKIPSGTSLQIALDAPVSVAGAVPAAGGY